MIEIDKPNPPARASVPSDEMLLLLKSIRRIVRASDLGSRSLQKTSGLTAPQLAALTAIGSMGEISTSKLAEQVDVSPATMVTILDNLEDRGLIQRYRSLTDRRIVHVRLTDEGAALLKRAPEPMPEEISARLVALEPCRRREMVAVLEEFSRLMERAKPEVGTAGTS